MKKSEIIFGVLRLPVDFIMIGFGFLTAYALRKSTDFIPYYNQTADLTSFPDPVTYIKLVSLFGIILIVLLIAHRSYSFKIYNTFSREGKSILGAWFAWMGLILLYYFIIREFPFSRLVIIFGWIFTFAYLIVGRAIIKLIQKILLRLGVGIRRIAVLGYNPVARGVIAQLGSDPQYKVVGIIARRAPLELAVKYLGNTDELKKIIQRQRIEELIQVSTDSSERENFEILDLCRETHTQYHFITDRLQLHKTKIDVQLISDYPLISLRITPLEGWGRVIKRVFDICLSSIALILLSPFFLLTAILIKLDSRGPVFFTKLDDGSPVMRVGMKGELFEFYKFRSMHDKTHMLRYTTLAEKNKRSGPMVKIENDPRITRVGRFIRKFDVDEWPQFWNVLKGDMSLVGPRPHLPEEVEKYDTHHRFVLSIKPGITGLAQVSGRSNLNFEEEISLDTFYIENWSLWLDIKICLLTFGVVLRGKGE